ncbi:MAG: helix-turn-helix domain-containing protein [Burkholderiales bacterium]
MALRCRIILGALAGQNNVSIAEELGVSRPTVRLWRTRVREQGIGEVWEIAPARQLRERAGFSGMLKLIGSLYEFFGICCSVP